MGGAAFLGGSFAGSGRDRCRRAISVRDGPTGTVRAIDVADVPVWIANSWAGAFIG